MNAKKRFALLVVAALAFFSIGLAGCDSSPTVASGKNDNPAMKQMRKAKKGDD